MKKKKMILSILGTLVAVAAISVSTFANRYFNIGEDPAFVQISKGVFTYTKGNEDVIVLDSSDINNLKLYSDDWDTVLSGQFAPFYEGGHEYAVGELCVYNNRLYKCNTAFTSDSQRTWVSGNFEPTTVKEMMDELGISTVSDMARMLGDVEPYNSSTTYEAGDIVSNDGQIYLCVTQSTTTGEFDSSSWHVTSVYELLGGAYANSRDMSKTLAEHATAIRKLTDDIGDAWRAGVSYKKGDYVIYANSLYRSLTDHTSVANFDSDKTSWESIKISDVLKTADDYKIDVSGGSSESDPYKITITKAS